MPRKAPKKAKPLKKNDGMAEAKLESYELFCIYTQIRREWGKTPHMAHLVQSARADWLNSVKTIRDIETTLSKRNRVNRHENRVAYAPST